MGFGRMTSMYKKHKLMKEQFSHDFYYQIVGWEVCDVVEVCLQQWLLQGKPNTCIIS
jgi:hypothetical protein